MTAGLKYLSEEVVASLRESVTRNISRYRCGDFGDLMEGDGWDLPLDVKIDPGPLAELVRGRGVDSEAANSRLVWLALGDLSPSLAVEEGIWTRLAHVECLEYARARWLPVDGTDKDLEKMAVKHLFARGLGGRRDDNAISRLWWNAWMADRIAPGTNLAPLETILKKADYRLNFIERSGLASRIPLAAGIVRLLEKDPWIDEREVHFRLLMKTVNKYGGGILFEAITAVAVDEFLDRCLKTVKSEADVSASV